MIPQLARTLPSILICFVGFIAMKYGLRRFGVKFKLSLIVVILLLMWIFAAAAQMFQGITVIALSIFVIGIFLWIVSLFFGRKQKKSTNFNVN